MVRPIDLVRVGYGVAEACAPRGILHTLGQPDADRATVAALRILGIRNLVQAVVLIASTRDRRVASATVDLVHAMTMVALSAIDRRHRAAGALSAIQSTIFAAAELS